MCWQQRKCTLMTPRCRCSIPAAARPRPDGCGLTCAMIVRLPVATHRRCGIAIPPIAKASIRNRTCAACAAFCRPTPTPDSGRCTRTGRSWKRHAGRMRGASSTIFTWWIARPSRPRRCSASVRCTRSNATFGARCRRSGLVCARSVPVHCSKRSQVGWKRRWRWYRRSPSWRVRSSTRWCGGQR
jgi:hypothetical protein